MRWLLWWNIENMCFYHLPRSLNTPIHNFISNTLFFFSSSFFSFFNGFSVKTNDNFYSSWPMKSTVRMRQVVAFGNTSSYLRSFTCVCSISRTPSTLTYVHTNMKFRRAHIFPSHFREKRKKKYFSKRTH